MCTPLALNVASTVYEGGMGVVDIMQKKQEAKYSAKIAETNAKMAIKNAQYEQQTGIEKAREEKIEGIKNANLVNAKNASYGFDVNSVTNKFNSQDTYKTSENNAKTIQNSYNQKAQNYFTQANQYLSNAENTLANYNSDILNSALGTTRKVSKIWSDTDSNLKNGKEKI